MILPSQIRGARLMRAAYLILMLGLAGPVAAQVIDSSPRPLPRPFPVAAPESEASPVAQPAIGDVIARSPRPLPRPKALGERIVALSAPDAPGLDLATDQAEADVDLAAVAPLTAKEKRRKKREAASMVGAVCGVPSIKGEVISPISSKVSGCGVEDAVQVTSVAGVRLSQAVTVDCSVVQALDSWVKEAAQPAFDGKLAEMRVAAHYVCRGRNNKKGGKISEHGKGRAIDISAFLLTDGKVLTVEDDYKKTLRKIYKAACGVFKTTLGPGSDGYHEDHFHFDTAIRNGGTYCR